MRGFFVGCYLIFFNPLNSSPPEGVGVFVVCVVVLVNMGILEVAFKGVVVGVELASTAFATEAYCVARGFGA